MSKKLHIEHCGSRPPPHICTTLAFGTAGIAMAGQRSHSHNHSSTADRDQGQSSNFAFGVVSALATNSITLKDRQGNTTSYTTTSATTYFEGKTAGTVTDLAVNEEVVLALTSSTPQTVTKVEIRLDLVAGAVTGVSGNTITIAGHHGSTFSVVVGNDHHVHLGRRNFNARGGRDRRGYLRGRASRRDGGHPRRQHGDIKAPHVRPFAFGVVSALATNSITLKDRQGNTTSYTTTSATTYFEGKTAGTVTDLAVNEEVGLALDLEHAPDGHQGRDSSRCESPARSPGSRATPSPSPVITVLPSAWSWATPPPTPRAAQPHRSRRS